MKKVFNIALDYILPAFIILSSIAVFIKIENQNFTAVLSMIVGVAFGGLIIFQSIREKRLNSSYIVKADVSTSKKKDNRNLGQTPDQKSNAGLKVNIKKLTPEAIIPIYAKNGDAGLDLVAVSELFNEEFLYKEYGTGLSVEIPEGYVGLIFPRSSISDKSSALSNAVGVIDSGYRGELKVRFKADGNVSGHFIKKMSEAPLLENEFKKYNLNHYKVGDKVAQLVILPYPQVELQEVQQLSETERGEGGYGHTGN